MIGPDLSIFKACSRSTRRPRSDGHLGNRRERPRIPHGVHTM